jgi:steroid delta-isomerase
MVAKEMMEQTIDAYCEALATLDGVAWAATFAPTGTLEDPVGTPPKVGPDAIREFAQGIAAGFRRVGVKKDQAFVAGNSAAIKWTGEAVAKDGRSVSFEGIDVIEMDDQGRITAMRGYWDPTPVLALHQA